jgi:hypothetical protein
MKRLINLNSGPLEGTSARGPPLAFGMGFIGSFRGLWLPQKHWRGNHHASLPRHCSNETQMETLCIQSEQVRCDGELPLHSH